MSDNFSWVESSQASNSITYQYDTGQAVTSLALSFPISQKENTIFKWIVMND